RRRLPGPLRHRRPHAARAHRNPSRRHHRPARRPILHHPAQNQTRRTLVTKSRFAIFATMAFCVATCVRNEYRFERFEGTQGIATPLKFDSLYGIRDGDSVKAELKFAAGGDTARVRLVLHLGPPAQFAGGVYRLSIGGRTSEGMVTCDSLTYL